MTDHEFEKLCDYLECNDASMEAQREAVAEMRRLRHNNYVLMDALWKSCGDDEQVVNDTIESQGELK